MKALTQGAIFLAPVVEGRVHDDEVQARDLGVYRLTSSQMRTPHPRVIKIVLCGPDRPAIQFNQHQFR
jgi:hypothetical protein